MAGVAMAALTTVAFAYRPFDGTDAAVAAPKEIEIELQPAGVLRESSLTSLIAPATIINYGFAKNWELVVQGFGQFPVSNLDENASLAGVGVFLKHVLREGSLQRQADQALRSNSARCCRVLMPTTASAPASAPLFRRSGTGNRSRKPRHSTDTRPSRGCLRRRNHRGTVEMEGAACDGDFLRERDRANAHDFRPGGSDMAGS